MSQEKTEVSDIIQAGGFSSLFNPWTRLTVNWTDNSHQFSRHLITAVTTFVSGGERNSRGERYTPYYMPLDGILYRKRSSRQKTGCWISSYLSVLLRSVTLPSCDCPPTAQGNCCSLPGCPRCPHQTAQVNTKGSRWVRPQHKAGKGKLWLITGKEGGSMQPFHFTLCYSLVWKEEDCRT